VPYRYRREILDSVIILKEDKHGQTLDKLAGFFLNPEQFYR